MLEGSSWDTAAILRGMLGLRALVVGDICLDQWCYYDPELNEPSRETGIPRIAVVHRESTPGAGGTIANNLAAMGIGLVSVLGCLGEDGYSHDLLRALRVRNIAPDLMIRSKTVATFTYTKLINRLTGKEDSPRVDYVNTEPICQEVEDEVLHCIETHLPDFDIILVSDQAETAQGGLITKAVRECINQQGAKHPEKVLWVDSRVRPEHFRNVIVKPNEHEANAACERLGLPEGDFETLARHGNLRSLFVTQGEKGVQVFAGGTSQVVPARSVQPVDICGAGDSFSAGAACALALTGSHEVAARFGNLVASVTVTKHGTGTASPDELRSAAQEIA